MMPTRSTRSIRLLLAAGLVSLVAACGGAGSGGVAESANGADSGTATTSAETTARPTDVAFAEADATPGTTLTACEILTPADIGKVIGTTGVADGTLKASPTSLDEAATNCQYRGDFGQVIVDLTPTDGANLYDAAASAYDGAVLFDGIGDGAFWAEKNSRAFFWKGSVNVMLTLFLTDGDFESTAEQLGTLAIGKL